jgi:hypothetical protein
VSAVEKACMYERWKFFSLDKKKFCPCCGKAANGPTYFGVVSDILMQPGCSFSYSPWLNSSTTTTHKIFWTWFGIIPNGSGSKVSTVSNFAAMLRNEAVGG